MTQHGWNSRSFILLAVGMALVATAVNSSEAEEPLTWVQAGSVEVPAPNRLVIPVPPPEVEVEGDRQGGRPPRPPPPAPSAFTVTFYEGGYCSNNNNDYSPKTCKRKDRCCYCGGLGDTVCQQVCQQANPRKFDAYSCDRCRCSCRYNK